MLKHEKKNSFFISSHCHKNWEDLLPTTNGRYCNECMKNVVDCTSLNNEEIQKIFLDQNNNMCGRLERQHIDWEIKVDFIKTPAWKKAIRWISLFILPVIAPKDSLAQKIKQRGNTSIEKLSIDSIRNEIIQIEGMLKSKLTEQPIDSAEIDLFLSESDSIAFATVTTNKSGIYYFLLSRDWIGKELYLEARHPLYSNYRRKIFISEQYTKIEIAASQASDIKMAMGMVSSSFIQINETKNHEDSHKPQHKTFKSNNILRYPYR